MTTAPTTADAHTRYRALVTALARGEDVELDEVLAVLGAAGKTTENLTADVDAAADSVPE
jgi:hypothetical protein